MKPKRAPRKKAPAAGAAPKTPTSPAVWAARKNAAIWVAIGVGGTVAVLLGALLLVYGRSRSGRAASVVEVDWPASLGAEDAADKLVELGLADNAPALAAFLRASGGTSDFVPGSHLLPTGASPWELKRLLSRSFFRPNAKLVVPEGFTRFDVAARVEKLKIASRRAFLAASSDPGLLNELGIIGDGETRPESVEGYLFPATYDLAVDTDPREVVKDLVATADKRWLSLAKEHEAGLDALRASLGWGRREVTILASIIEKEAAVDDERPMIASVFLNRLQDPEFHPKRLQSDPTSSYGCVAWPDEAPSCKGFSGKPTPAINRDAKNRYSTYVHTGLPPGPISNPGARSLEAVLAPSKTHYLFFVAAGSGRHAFSETLDAHNDAVTRGRTP